MGRNGRVLAAALIVAASAAMAATPGGAADDTTDTQFTIGAAGTLAVNAPANADLGTVPAGSTLVSGSLGSVTVDDTRNLTIAAWTVSVSSTDFSSGASTVTKDNVTYLTGTATGSVGFVGTASAFALTGALPAGVFAGTGNNSVSWNPTISVVLPPGQLSGTYTGVITHSVA